MRYLCLVYHEEKKLDALSGVERDALAVDCMAWVEDLDRAGHHVFSAGLQSIRMAATVRNRNGKPSTSDGPFAETKESLSGFTLIEARDLNEAIQLASKHPAARLGSIEVRPTQESDVASIHTPDRKVGAAIRRSGDPTTRHDLAEPPTAGRPSGPGSASRPTPLY
jgi:hypothetical protein